MYYSIKHNRFERKDISLLHYHTNYTTLKQEYERGGDSECFTTIRNYTTLKYYSQTANRKPTGRVSNAHYNIVTSHSYLSLHI